MNLKKYFGSFEVPKKLSALLEFQESQSKFGMYSFGFGIRDETDVMKYWAGIEGKELLAVNKRLIPFARANSTGSFYAFWHEGINKSLDNTPIAVFGDEGGQGIVCKNIAELLTLLSLDTEVEIDESRVYFYKLDKNDEYFYQSEDYSMFTMWLKEKYNIDKIDTNDKADMIVENAQKQYQEAFLKWLSEFVKI